MDILGDRRRTVSRREASRPKPEQTEDPVVDEELDIQSVLVEAFQESERRYRLLAENVTDVIWTTDLNLNLTYVSPSITRVVGYSVEEVMAETTEKS